METYVLPFFYVHYHYSHIFVLISDIYFPLLTFVFLQFLCKFSAYLYLSFEILTRTFAKFRTIEESVSFGNVALSSYRCHVSNLCNISGDCKIVLVYFDATWDDAFLLLPNISSFLQCSMFTNELVKNSKPLLATRRYGYYCIVPCGSRFSSVYYWLIDDINNVVCARKPRNSLLQLPLFPPEFQKNCHLRVKIN